VDGVDIANEEGTVERHLVVRNAEGLLGLAQMNVLEFHPWGSQAESAESPDRLVFDLDPGKGVTWRQTVEAAVLVREALSQLKLRGFARVSGGKGVHIVVALRPGHDWEQAKSFARAFAETLVKVAPARFVATPGESRRENRIFIDYLRNTRGATAIASYSTRARPGAPVAVPVSWDELEGLGSGAALCVPAVLKRIAAGGRDPWGGLEASAGVLPVEKSERSDSEVLGNPKRSRSRGKR
jgi:bifunctional non-homologous end joining protein LigD